MKTHYVQAAPSAPGGIEVNQDWKQVAASFALEGIELQHEDAAIARRLLNGEISYEEGIDEICRALGLNPPSSLELVRG